LPAKQATHAAVPIPEAQAAAQAATVPAQRIFFRKLQPDAITVLIEVMAI
jgi:hypothetical protein